MSNPTNNPRPDEAWQIRHARALLAESNAAESSQQNAAQYWGKFEAVLEALLAHLDEQEGTR